MPPPSFAKQQLLAQVYAEQVSGMVAWQRQMKMMKIINMTWMSQKLVAKKKREVANEGLNSISNMFQKIHFHQIHPGKLHMEPENGFSNGNLPRLHFGGFHLNFPRLCSIFCWFNLQDSKYPPKMGRSFALRIATHIAPKAPPMLCPQKTNW